MKYSIKIEKKIGRFNPNLNLPILNKNHLEFKSERPFRKVLLFFPNYLQIAALERAQNRSEISRN
ncbi:MAG: hypothetical protein ACI9DJ_001356 [Algoriphagus sp.]|jgi:hypothetical protein